jgi:ethanolamine ammonia-lyase small subunit
MNEDQIKKIIEQVVSEVVSRHDEPKGLGQGSGPVVDPGSVPDLSAIDFRTVLSVPNPANPDEYLRIMSRSAARLGVWRAGPRYRTQTLLRFRADHATAMDSVFTDVPEALLEEMHLFSVSTVCRDKDEFLTRPDLGRQFSPETLALLKQKCKPNPDIQIYVSDGLSSTAIVANLKDVLPALMQGLQSKGLGNGIGTPFFVKYGRVGAMDVITETLGAKVCLVFLGERPGLASGESMSAYITYGGFVGMPEAGRTVVSNIHRGGTNAAEAGAHIADILALMLREKASGIELQKLL